MERMEIVFDYLQQHGIAYSCYHHPEGKTIEEAKKWWKDDGSIHCKNIFLRNHKGNKHYLVCYHCDKLLDIRWLENRLKEHLSAQGLSGPGKLSFASPARTEHYLGLEHGSVSPFGLINDVENHVHLFLDNCLLEYDELSFHPNDCRATVVIAKEEFLKYLQGIGNSFEFIEIASSI